MQEQTSGISVVTGIVIQNEHGDVWLGRMPKWSNQLSIVGGHVERGELIAAAARREVREETGLTVDTLAYLGYIESIDPSDFHKPKHFISFDFCACVQGRPDIRINDEFTESMWLSLDEALARDDINSLSRQTLERLKKGAVCADCDGYKTGWQRAQADYQNLQKEIATKRSEWAAISEWQILEAFVPIYDNFKKAFRTDHASWNVEQQNWVKGIGYIMKQFADVLQSHGIEEIETVQKMFDPNLHEVLGEETSDKGPGTILKEVDGGYKKGDRVLKVAKVIVAK